MDPMWGRSGPSIDPYQDPIWMPMSGSSGPVAGGAWLGGDGKWCSRIGRECALHKTINIALEICINVYTMSIFNSKYKPFRTVRKFTQNVNITLEICVKVLHLIKNVNISFEICTIVGGSCADHSKMSIFHLKYV